MFNPPQPPRSRFSTTAIVLILFLAAAGAGIFYLSTAEKTPSWLSFLIPSTSFTPSEEEKKIQAQSEAAEPQTAALPTKPVSPPAGAKVARPPASMEKPEPASEPPAATSEESSGEAPQPVLSVGTGKPAAPNGTMVRGEIPEGQHSPGIYQTPPPAQSAQTGPGATPQEDGVVPLAIIQDMAKFLAANFWPAGSHPMARNGAITTATVKWANVKYGGQLQGFGVTGADAAAKRKTALDYVFTPAMLNSLYAMYSQRFFETFDKEARALTRGPDKKPLDSAQLGDMYDVYAVASQGMVETIYAYLYTPNARELVSEYAVAATEASEAYRLFAANLQNGNASNVEIARRYQSAILERDQKRDALTAALLQHGASRTMDADSLAYVAQWLFRRGEDKKETLTALAAIIHTCALTFRSIGTQYDDIAYSQGLR